MDPIYLELFQDVFLSNFLLTLNIEKLFFILMAFGSFSKIHLLFFSTGGSISACYINFLIGQALAKIIDKSNIQTKNKTSNAKLNKYGFLILLLSWHNMAGPIVTFVCGIFRISLLRFSAIVIPAVIIYRAYLIF